MKLPASKRTELEKEGKRKSPPLPGGGALGRLRQFEQQRGLEQTEPAHEPSTPNAVHDRTKPKGKTPKSNRTSTR